MDIEGITVRNFYVKLKYYIEDYMWLCILGCHLHGDGSFQTVQVLFKIG